MREGTEDAGVGRAQMTEDRFLQAVVNLAHLRGWLAVHHRTSARKVGGRWISNIRGDRGSPDVLLARAPRVILAELKLGTRMRDDAGHLPGGTYGLTADQVRWRDALLGCPGVTYAVWTPDDMETIAAVLA